MTGHDAAQWFVSNMEGVGTVEESERVGQRLLEIGLITEIQGITCHYCHYYYYYLKGCDTFSASKTSYYQFTDQTSLMTPYTSRLPLLLITINNSLLTRPTSAISMLSVGGYRPQVQYRTGSLPTVYSPL